MVYFLALINNIAELCKGSTPVSGTVCLGSNPSSAAKEDCENERFPQSLFYLFCIPEKKRNNMKEKR